jgi:hypothetical protein
MAQKAKGGGTGWPRDLEQQDPPPGSLAIAGEECRGTVGRDGWGFLSESLPCPSQMRSGASRGCGRKVGQTQGAHLDDVLDAHFEPLLGEGEPIHLELKLLTFLQHKCLDVL